MDITRCLLKFPVGNLDYSDDTASMALPSGHAASTNELPYLTFFTNVISCQGSRPVQEEKQRTKMEILEFEIYFILFFQIN